MGNTSASQKDSSANAPRAAKDLDDLLPALRERFEELAGLPASEAPLPPPRGAAVATTASEGHVRQQQQQQQQGKEEEESFVFFDDWWYLPGPRGAEVAKRLYGVLDANGDGRLSFEEFAGAACLLKGSPHQTKLELLFRMYGDASRGGLVGREGLKALILDVIAASPPLLTPPALAVTSGGGGSSSDSPRSSSAWALQQQQQQQQPDFEKELGGILAKMADVVLTEYDADNDGLLTEKEWRAYLKQEEDSVIAFLDTLSDSVGNLLLPP
ncbi:unnamed protein product [Ectocarpus sp. 12 AP-2014]